MIRGKGTNRVSHVMVKVIPISSAHSEPMCLISLRHDGITARVANLHP